MEWGDQGYCYFPYAYLTIEELTGDLWTIRMGKDLNFEDDGETTDPGAP